MLALSYFGARAAPSAAPAPAPSLPKPTFAPAAPVYASGGGGFYPQPRQQFFVQTDCVRDPSDPANKCCPYDRIIDGRCALPYVPPLSGATALSVLCFLPALGLIALGVYAVTRRKKRR